MALSPPVAADFALPAPAARAGALGAARRALRRHPTLIAGALTLIVILVAGVLAPLWWTGDPLEMKPAVRLRPPSGERWFGSDNFGRDIYTRTLYGSRISLAVAAAGFSVGRLLGSTHGHDARPRRRFLPEARHDRHAGHGWAHGHPGYPPGTRPHGPHEGERAERHHRAGHSRDSAGGSSDPRVGAVTARAFDGGRGTGPRPANAAYPGPLRIARPHRATDRAGHVHCGVGDPLRSVPVVSRSGHASTHSVVGQHHGGRARLRSARLLDHPVSRYVPGRHGPRHQSRR